jgi:hypothetical protein
LHNTTAAALGSWIECELEKWVWDDNKIHTVGHVSTSVVAFDVLCSKLWVLERTVSQIFAISVSVLLLLTIYPCGVSARKMLTVVEQQPDMVSWIITVCISDTQ